MTKKKEDGSSSAIELQKKLTWKLKDAPTVEDITELLENNVITSDEARQILFKEEEPKTDADRIEALEEQIKLLTDLIKHLPNNNLTYVPYIREIEVPRKYLPYWKEVWMSTGGTAGGYVNSSLGSFTTTTQSLNNGNVMLTVSNSKEIS